MTVASKNSLEGILACFGGNVRRERQARGLTQLELAERVDLHPRVIQKIEAGETNILMTTVLRLQAALGCPWAALMPLVAVARFTKPRRTAQAGEPADGTEE